NHARQARHARPNYPPLTGPPQHRRRGSGTDPAATGCRNDRRSQNNSRLAPKRIPAFTLWRQRNREAAREAPRWAGRGSVAFIRCNESRNTKKSTHAACSCERLQPVKPCTTRCSLTGLLSEWHLKLRQKLKLGSLGNRLSFPTSWLLHLLSAI